MKRITIAIILFLTSLSIYSQDTEPTAWQFKWGDSDQGRIFEPDSFKQTTIFNGFQWYGSRKMNDALLNNARAAGSYDIGTGNENNPLFLVHQPYWVDGAYFKPGYFNAPFMQYEPTFRNLESGDRKQEFEKSPAPSHQSPFQQCKSTSEIGINPKMFNNLWSFK